MFSNFILTIQSYPHTLEIVGVAGFLIYIGSFLFVQMGLMCGNSISYSLSKVLAATCVLISLAGAFNLASFLIQISFILIGSWGAFVRWRHRRRAHFISQASPVPHPAN